MRVRLKGLHVVSARLASGEVKKYYYAYRGGPALQGKPGSPEFMIAWNEAHAALRRPDPQTMMSIIAAYRGSVDFGSLAASSQSAYIAYIKIIEIEFGDLPLAALDDPRMRGEFKAWRDQFAATPRKADYAWATLHRILSFGKDRGLIRTNPCDRGGRLYRADRVEKIWREHEIQRFCEAASPELQLAMVLALWTGQRQGDLLRLTWADYDGTALRRRQGKRRKHVIIPCGETLKLALDTARARTSMNASAVRPMTILTNSRGRPWTGDGFRASWAKAFAKADLEADLHFHDLRGTAVTRLALAGCTVPQIAAITGHSLKDVEVILSAHYLGGTVELAESAIVKLNAKYGS